MRCYGMQLLGSVGEEQELTSEDPFVVNMHRRLKGSWERTQ